MDEASDAALVVAIARYDEQALAEIYRRHGGAVMALATRVVRSAALAEEVTQEIFVRLWSDPQRFDPARGSLRTFLLAQAHGRAVDSLRSEVARRRREDGAELSAEARYDLEREVVDITVAEHVRAALDELSDAERRSIDLAYFGGHSYREVAQLLDEPEGTVKSRIRVGLRRLRTALVDAGVTVE